ncbi:glycosyltransferase family 4 protein [Flagellimonas myxillae]|uniref:glycosyltransferase family 4 protein n=1 Tax=Flagellimonas myxillae TaxID=2942214 RepID=UPI00201EA4EF|nr:glycosyltransferase family 4 protein [Muricauda myxillae]MCL6266223.1 glycosyltransferase family 4 protein [Muricauda myxillae]
MAEVKKVIFVALGFPNVEERRFLYSNLMLEYHYNGHDVFVIAGDNTIRRSKICLEGGLKVLRVPSLELYGNNKVIKGISNLMLPYLYKRALKKHKVALDFDLIFMPTPPITLIDVAFWLKKKTRGKLYLILRDIFPQNAIDLKMMKANSFIHSYFRKKEVKLYQTADSIGCMSPANVEYVKEHNPYLDHGKLHLLPNWADVRDIKEVDNGVGKEHFGLENKVVAIFGGNMGLPQKLENVIELAKRCREIEDLVFYLVGRGSQQKKIAKMIADSKLNNVILKEHLPKSDYNALLRVADIGLISLHEDFTIPNYPSKVLSYYQFKKPVLASVDVNTDFGRFQEEINCGLWSEAGDTEAFKENLLKLYSDAKLREKLGQNGYDYMINNLTPGHAYNTVIQHV